MSEGRGTLNVGAGEGNRIYHVVSAPCISMQCCAAYECTIFRRTARSCTQLQEFWHQLAPKFRDVSNAQMPHKCTIAPEGWKPRAGTTRDDHFPPAAAALKPGASHNRCC